MHGVVASVLVALAVFVVVVAAGTSLAVWRLRRRNRVSPTQASPAPVVWLWLPTPGARLHRRLHNLVAVAHLAGARGGLAADLVSDVEQQAVTLDHHVVITARLPRSQRARQWRALTEQVVQLEVLASRLVIAAVEAASHPALAGGSPDPLARIAERLDALDAARADLAGVEHAAGLDRHRAPRPAPRGQ